MAEPFICVGIDGYSFSYDKLHTKTNPHPRNFTYHNKTARQCLAVLLARERSLPAEGLLNAASIRDAAL